MPEHILRVILFLLKFKVYLQLTILLRLPPELLLQSLDVLLKALDCPSLYFHLSFLLLNDLQELFLVEDFAFWVILEVFDVLLGVVVVRRFVLDWHGAELVEGCVACC